MASPLTDELIRKAKKSAEETESLRRQMLLSSDRRAEAVFALAAEGMAIRKIADATAVSPPVIQRLLEKAKASRPALERREERVSYEMHRVVAGKVTEDPKPVLAKARENLQKMKARSRGAQATGWVQEWERLISGDVSKLIEVMLRPDERGIDLRQMTPFAGVLSQEERLVAIHKAQKSARAA
jgi:hypothetical protein